MRTWVAVLLLLLAGAARAQEYVDTLGLYHLVVHPYDGKRIVAAIGQRVYFSRDGGASWQRSPNLPAFVNTERLFVPLGHPDVVYLKTPAWFVFPLVGPFPETVTGGELYRSADFGRTWTRVAQDGTQPTGSFEPRVVTPTGADPTDPRHLYGTRQGTWNCRFCGTFVERDYSLHESRDGGATWSLLFDAGSYGFVHISYPTPASPRRLFVVVQGYAGRLTLEAHLSLDGGRTWSRFVPGFTHTPFWIEQDPHDARILYGSGTLTDGTRNVIARSDDGGHSWRVIHEFPVREWNVGQLTLDPYRIGRLWLSVHAGLMRSDDRGATWTSLGFEAGARPIGDPTERPRVRKVVPSPAGDPQAYLVADHRLTRGSAPLDLRVAVEYRYGERYWVSADRGETISQDYRAYDAVRTGQKFGVWSRDDAPAGARAMCRFQGDPSRGQSSRFIALDGFECDIVKSAGAWSLEGEGEYFAVPPSDAGTCAAGLVPVRRFNNLQDNVNHRYVANAEVAGQMRAAGWYDEGVRFCARPLGSNE